MPPGDRMGPLRACALISAVLAGCAHKPAAASPTRAELELSELRAQIVARDREIRELEGRVALLSSPPVEPTAARETVRIPSRGAHEAPDDVPEPAPLPAEPVAQRDAKAADLHPHADAPRPFLRLHEKAEPSGARAEAPIASAGERLAVVSLPGADASAADGADDLYLRAIDLVRRREFAAALRELDAFVLSFADDPRSMRALYWRGEVLFAQREWARALESYESALARAPQGEKAPDTLLRIARCCLKLGANDRARETLARLEAQFPDSEAAHALKRGRGSDEDG